MAAREQSAAGLWPTARTTVVGVMGDPIAHSLSPVLFNSAFAALDLDWVMVAFPVAAGSTSGAIDGMKALDLAGMSVTMPHKDAVVPLVDELSELAARLGAVNSIVAHQGHLTGHNTDGEGFLASLARATEFDPDGRRCMVLGAGGAARAVIAALADARAAEIVIVNRTAARAEQATTLGAGRALVGDGSEADAMDLIVNATPMGMHDTHQAHEGHFVTGTKGQVVVDLVYHPLQTAWLEQGQANGAITVTGLGMLVHQAAAQLKLWTGYGAPTDVMWHAAESLLK